jgi:hypothetical protein
VAVEAVEAFYFPVHARERSIVAREAVVMGMEPNHPFLLPLLNLKAKLVLMARHLQTEVAQGAMVVPQAVTRMLATVVMAAFLLAVEAEVGFPQLLPLEFRLAQGVVVVTGMLLFTLGNRRTPCAQPLKSKSKTPLTPTFTSQPSSTR